MRCFCDASVCVRSAMGIQQQQQQQRQQGLHKKSELVETRALEEFVFQGATENDLAINGKKNVKMRTLQILSRVRTRCNSYDCDGDGPYRMG